MLSSLRNVTKSRFGLIFVFLFLGVIAIAFALTDTMNTRTQQSLKGNELARVGGRAITDADLRNRIETLLREMRGQGQNVTMAQVVATGAFDQLLNELIDTATLIEFGQASGMRVSNKLIDGEISSEPGFQGADGKFSQKSFDAWLSQSGLTPAELRSQISEKRYVAWLLYPAVAESKVPDQLINTYASLMLEQRKGTVALIQAGDMPMPAQPDDKALAAYYKAHTARYNNPERRVLSYVTVRLEALKAEAKPTDAEIAEAYKQAGTRFAATEKRSVRILVIADQAAAQKAANEVKGGKALTAVASEMGLESRLIENVEKAEFSTQSASPALADAAFGADQGAVVGPVKATLGWSIAKVEKVEKIAAKTLDQARAELTDEIATTKAQDALVKLRQELEDAIGDGEAFQAMASDARLKIEEVGPLAANGLLADGSKADDALAPIVRAGFTEAAKEEPQEVPIAADGSFAVVSPKRIIAPAPPPLEGEMVARVRHDYIVDEQLKLARAKAVDIAKKVNAGTPLREAIAAAQLRNPRFETFDLRRAQLNTQERISPGVRMAFTMQPKKARFVEQGRDGYLVVFLDEATMPDGSKDEKMVASIRREIQPQIGQEHVASFVDAIRRQVKISRNEAAIQAFKANLTGAAR